jgi:hypothetical protein
MQNKFTVGNHQAFVDPNSICKSSSGRIDGVVICSTGTTGNENIVESGVEHHNPNLINDHLVALISLVACANVRPCLDFQRGYQKLVLFICQILSILIHAKSVRDLRL